MFIVYLVLFVGRCVLSVVVLVQFISCVRACLVVLVYVVC